MTETEKLALRTAQINYYLTLKNFCNSETVKFCFNKECDKCSVDREKRKLREIITEIF